jgi:FKBP-type peptidyl-prolyl cis-trans isomerase
VHYKGWLYSNGNVFDETKEKPATFPLSRLIKGWQTGLIECRVGGKIRLFIPSGSAYGIRTFSPNIPPNSILVFDVEVLEVKEKVEK